MSENSKVPTAKSRSATVKKLAKRAEAAGRSFEYVTPPDDDIFDPLEDDAVRLGFASGREETVVTISGTDIDALEQLPFEQYRVVADYHSLVRESDGSLEVQLVRVSAASRVPTSLRGLWLIPGANIEYDLVEADDPSGDADIVRTPIQGREPTRWSLVAQRDGRRIEISRPSAEFTTLWRMRTYQATLKLYGFDTTAIESCRGLLEGIAKDFLFELDVRYGVSMDLHRKGPTRRRTRLRKRIEEAPEFPRNHYAAAPLELYRHGRSADGLPLLQYQYFYQTIEYFFPVFIREEAIRRIRQELQNPRFSTRTDENIARLIELSVESGSGNIREREQLRRAVAGSVDATTLTGWIEELNGLFEDQFTQRRQPLSGVRPLDLKGNVADQVADRIYAIRCRIVHAKEDGGTTQVEPLLPSSPQVAYLTAEIELVQRIAQSAIIARAEALS